MCCRLNGRLVVSMLLTRMACVHSVWATGPTVPLGSCIMHTGGVVVATPRVASCTHRAMNAYHITRSAEVSVHCTIALQKVAQRTIDTPRCLDLCMEMSTMTKWSWLPSTCPCSSAVQAIGVTKRTHKKHHERPTPHAHTHQARTTDAVHSHTIIRPSRQALTNTRSKLGTRRTEWGKVRRRRSPQTRAAVPPQPHTVSCQTRSAEPHRSRQNDSAPSTEHV
jgi:hypothetical protein